MKTVDEADDNVDLKSEGEEEEEMAKGDEDERLEVASCSDKELDEDSGGSVRIQSPIAPRNGREPPVFSSAFTSANLEVFKCSECAYETYNVATLQSHQKIHKLYQCDICQMKFSHAANMRRHRMRHTGFKPFECRVCLKRFFRKDHLMEHMITHSKQLPFQCPMCDKSFNRQVYFKAHLQTDHWNRPGDKICAICGHKAATIKGAKLHYTTRHAKAANTVNSSSPANSRSLAGEITPILRSGFMSDGEAFHLPPSSPLDGSQGSVSSSQLVFPPPPLTDSMSGFVVPLTVSSLHDGGLRSRLAHRSGSVTLHRIAGGRYGFGCREARASSHMDGDLAEAIIIKSEPADETADSDDDEREGSILPDQVREHSPSGHSHSETCSPNSTLDLVRGALSSAGSPSAAAAFASASALHRQVSVGDVTITPLGGALVCVHCGIVFPDQTLYFLHKGVHSENNPWKCNICGEPCRDKYDFNTHILSKAHQ